MLNSFNVKWEEVVRFSFCKIARIFVLSELSAQVFEEFLSGASTVDSLFIFKFDPHSLSLQIHLSYFFEEILARKC